jgi:hypothetical protein
MAPASPSHDAFQRSTRVLLSYSASSRPAAPLRAGGITLAPSMVVVSVTRLGLASGRAPPRAAAAAAPMAAAPAPAWAARPWAAARAPAGGRGRQRLGHANGRRAVARAQVDRAAGGHQHGRHQDGERAAQTKRMDLKHGQILGIDATGHVPPPGADFRHAGRAGTLPIATASPAMLDRLTLLPSAGLQPCSPCPTCKKPRALLPGLMGVRLLQVSPERVRAEMLVRADLCTTGGTLHGARSWRLPTRWAPSAR